MANNMKSRAPNPASLINLDIIIQNKNYKLGQIAEFTINTLDTLKIRPKFHSDLKPILNVRNFNILET